jgi:hypothetical protein
MRWGNGCINQEKAMRMDKKTIDGLLGIIETIEQSYKRAKDVNAALNSLLPQDYFRGQYQEITCAIEAEIVRHVDGILGLGEICSYYLYECLDMDGGSCDGIPIRSIDDLRLYVYYQNKITE